MYCHFEATTMNKQISFVVLSCVFATVYLQQTIDDTLEALVKSNIHDFYKNEEPLYLSQVLLHETFEVMSQGYYLVHVRASNNKDVPVKFICTVVLKTEYNSKSPNVTGTECNIDDRHIPLIQPLVNLGYFGKTINKAVDLINNEPTHRMIATSLKEITLTITGGRNFEYRFELTVGKTSCPNTGMNKEYDNISCPILTNNQALSEKYRVIGQIEQHSPDDPVVYIHSLGAAHSTC